MMYYNGHKLITQQFAALIFILNLHGLKNTNAQVHEEFRVKFLQELKI